VHAEADLAARASIDEQGSDRQASWNAFKEFGQSVPMDESTDWETPEQVPWTGLQSSTRAFAKIIDEVNKLLLSKLRK